MALTHQELPTRTSYVRVATCNLNQHAMDFKTNLAHVEESIRQAKAAGCGIRIGPELELSGYTCEDHFYETDTIDHCWDALAEILASDITNGIYCDIGMPVLHLGVKYNCRVHCLNQKVIMVRPKMYLADDGNYREGRWFAPWGRGFTLEDFTLPKRVQVITGQLKVPIGVGVVKMADTIFGNETCEELFTANNPGIQLGLSGCEILGNGSGSHHTLGKHMRRVELVEEETKKNGGCYLYANHRGCDGGRLYFDGFSTVAVNGHIVAAGSQFKLLDVELVVATVDLRAIRAYRSSISSRERQASTAVLVPSVDCTHYRACLPDEVAVVASPTDPIALEKLEPEAEVAFAPACWMWDYLRRSGLAGFFLPLSGGADSGATATNVHVMCQLVNDAIQAGDANVLADLRKVTRDPKFKPKTSQDIAKKIFYCVYMPTEHSSTDTRDRARNLAKEIGCNFDIVNISGICDATVEAYKQIGPAPNIRRLDSAENIACQNIQARTRMMFSYLCAQLLMAREHPENPWPGMLLVLGSANMDEGLRGYFTKYDCSSADINPIGSIPKLLLRSFLHWAAEKRGLPALKAIATCKATAELQPVDEKSGKQEQISEEEMGLSFEELTVFGKLRIEARCGPVAAYEKLVRQWGAEGRTPTQVAEKVKRFFKYYAINRHKMTTITPSVHLSNYSPDDNRYDLRQFLYNVAWPWQFERIDQLVAADEKRLAAARAATAPGSTKKRERSAA